MAQRRGDLAKQSAIATIQTAFGDDFVGLIDKKLYVNVKDGPNGEVVQLSIALTMPKTPVSASAPATDGNAAAWESKPATPTELSAEDKAKVADLCARLGI
jgi:hypothetical protein